MGCAASTPVATNAAQVKVPRPVSKERARARLGSGQDSDYGDDSDDCHGGASDRCVAAMNTMDRAETPAVPRVWVQRRGWTDTVSVCQYCIVDEEATESALNSPTTGEERRRSGQFSDDESVDWATRLPDPKLDPEFP